jgi:NAD(P)-dependent dehydrogenase (short-subunit alcohol dehydrogenase family)
MGDLDFSGRTVLVTGGTRGIGRGIADAFAARGAGVAIAARDATAVRDHARELSRRYGGTHLGVVLDVTSPSSVAEAITAVVAAFGRLDIAVNNAGIANSVAYTDMDEETWRTVLSTNLDGVYRCCREELAVMASPLPGESGAPGTATAGGAAAAIINIASISGSMVNVPQFQANYNASKAAVIGLTRSLAVEYARRGVRVNSVSPGYTLTDMNRREEVQDLIATWTERTPMRRLADVEEIAGPVLFLASSMAGFITGHDLVVDGGITILC